MSAFDELPELCTTTIVAAIFAVKAATIRSWIKDGRFPNARLVHGGKDGWRIPKADVLLLAEKRHG